MDKKLVFRTNFVPFEKSFEVNNEKSQTMPGMAYTNKQILSRLRSGLPVQSGMMEYTGEEYRHIIHDPTDLDNLKEQAISLRLRMEKVEKLKEASKKAKELEDAVQKRLKELRETPPNNGNRPGEGSEPGQ